MFRTVGNYYTAELATAQLDDREAARQALRRARDQGAFTFWNHPYWSDGFQTGVVSLPRYHKELIEAGLIHGIEVANGSFYSREVFEIALEQNLAVLGCADIHGLIDYEYDINAGGR